MAVPSTVKKWREKGYFFSEHKKTNRYLTSCYISIEDGEKIGHYFESLICIRKLMDVQLAVEATNYSLPGERSIINWEHNELASIHTC